VPWFRQQLAEASPAAHQSAGKNERADDHP